MENVSFDGKTVTLTLTADDLRADKLKGAGFKPFMSDEDWMKIRHLFDLPECPMCGASSSLERETIEDVIYLIAEKARAEDANAGD